MLNAYYALCYSRLAYGCLLWGGARDWQRVFVAQKRIIRLLFGLPSRESCRVYIRQNNILTFPCTYILKALVYIKQKMNDFAKYYRPYNTRHVDLPIAQHRTALYQKSPHYNFIKMFNKLPETVREISSPRAFKFRVRELLIRGGYYSQQEFLDDVF